MLDIASNSLNNLQYYAIFIFNILNLLGQIDKKKTFTTTYYPNANAAKKAKVYKKLFAKANNYYQIVKQIKDCDCNNCMMTDSKNKKRNLKNFLK